MSITLNTKAVEHAKHLIQQGKVVRDDRDDWSEDAPSTDEENNWLDKHSFDDFSKWHLGVDRSASEGTKGRYSFPFGDYAKVHRCAVIAAESRAGQYDHPTIEKAAKQLLDLIDAPKR